MPALEWNTDLNKQRPGWIPQSTISKVGLLSTQNFFHRCWSNDLPLDEQQKKMKWFFFNVNFLLLAF